METWYYDVVRIEGDYAYLKRTDKEIDDEKNGCEGSFATGDHDRESLEIRNDKVGSQSDPFMQNL